MPRRIDSEEAKRVVAARKQHREWRKCKREGCDEYCWMEGRQEYHSDACRSLDHYHRNAAAINERRKQRRQAKNTTREAAQQPPLEFEPTVLSAVA